MSTFDESLVSRDSAGRFDVRSPGPPTASLEEPESARMIDGQNLSRVVASMVLKQQHRVGDTSDVDEVVQNACLEIGKTYGWGRIPLAPIRQVVSRTLARSQGHTSLGSTDRRALSALAGLRRAREEELGRGLTWREEEALADRVRQEWPDARHRPSRDLLRKARMARPSSIHRDDGALVEGTGLWAGTEGAPAADPATATGRVEAALNGPGRSSARRDAWDALAELREADGGGRVPRVRARTHSPRAAAWARRTMDDYPGGVLGAVDRWGQAVEDDGTTALFAPFDAADEEGRDAVCDLLASHPTSADDLWAAALTASTRGRETQPATGEEEA
ncbi:hypothetical protein [Actinomyces gaoshouyii]|uniref:hypothetical protein n=1 Tax=Actinomyces gaoshouyii TaxID=1960083 RepID=UPI0009BE0F0A|nr:hypothetical protein [Actinomyces gaoshouyii]ARD42480.1 hypothetical protein B6G06_09130 [Actinomyces gaoshouyii]